MSAKLAPLSSEFSQAIQLIDEAHSQDPRIVDGPSGVGQGIPYELHYAQKMTQWLEIRYPSAPASLQLACRAQHFRRWEIPRSSFPMTRPGYLIWRAKLKAEAAQQVVELLALPSIQPAIPDEGRERVAALIRKENLGSDEHTQVLEDVACLVFLDDQFENFERTSHVDEEKLISILRKTWLKMSEEGRQLALHIDLSEKAKLLLGKALEA